MTSITDIKAKPGSFAKLAAGLIVSVLLGPGALAVPAGAEDDGDHVGWTDGTGQYRWDHRGEHRDWVPHRDLDSRFYRTPPVVYGSPYDYPPPVIYAPGDEKYREYR